MQSENTLQTNPIRVWKTLLVPVIFILVLSLLYFYFMLRPPVSDLSLMMLLLLATAIISTTLVYTVYRLGWMKNSPGLLWTLVGGYLLSSILTFLNVWITAQLMFADRHDLLLATVLLFFATGIAFVIGYFFSSTLVERITRLKLMALQVAQGNFNARSALPGKDELAELANTFNLMAEQLENAEQKKLEIEFIRRDLIAWISHDLQTPLASIRAMVEALSDGVVEDQATTGRYLRSIHREVGSMSDLIDKYRPVVA